MKRTLLLVCLPFFAFAGCATPLVDARGPRVDVGFARLDEAPPQDVVEERAERPRSYLTVGGGLTFLKSQSNGTPDTDTDSANIRIGGGYRPSDSIDVSLNNDIILSSTSTGGVRISSRVNNIGVAANFMLNKNAETEFYLGPNLGIYNAKIEGAGASVSSTNISGGFQLGMRHWLSQSSALKVEWRNVWSEQDTFGGGSSDVHQATIIVSFDVWF